VKKRHKWAGRRCVHCGIERRATAEYKGRFDYLINGVWEFRPITPACTANAPAKEQP